MLQQGARGLIFNGDAASIKYMFVFATRVGIPIPPAASTQQSVQKEEPLDPNR